MPKTNPEFDAFTMLVDNVLAVPHDVTQRRLARAQGAGRKESQQAGAEREAQGYPRFFGPRFKVLVGSRFSNLADDFGVSQPFLAVVVPERFFVKVAEQLKRLDADVGARQAPLKQAPEVLQPVSYGSGCGVGFADKFT